MALERILRILIEVGERDHFAKRASIIDSSSPGGVLLPAPYAGETQKEDSLPR